MSALYRFFTAHASGRASESPSAPGRRGRRGGFTLVELLIVMAILVLLAAVGFSQVARSRMAAREALALQHLKTIAKGCQLFVAAQHRLPETLAELGPPISTPPYLDASLAQDPAVRQGYQFFYVRQAPGRFFLTANPVQHGATGLRHFLINQSLRVFYTDEDRDANPAVDPRL